MKKFKGNFMREVFWDTTILSALIIVPMLFLGPGWRMPVHRPFAELHTPNSHASSSSLRDDNTVRDDHEEVGDDDSRR